MVRGKKINYINDVCVFFALQSTSLDLDSEVIFLWGEVRTHFASFQNTVCILCYTSCTSMIRCKLKYTFKLTLTKSKVFNIFFWRSLRFLCVTNVYKHRLIIVNSSVCFCAREDHEVGARSPTLSTTLIVACICPSPACCSAEPPARRSLHGERPTLSCNSTSQVVFLETKYSRHCEGVQSEAHTDATQNTYSHAVTLCCFLHCSSPVNPAKRERGRVAVVCQAYRACFILKTEDRLTLSFLPFLQKGPCASPLEALQVNAFDSWVKDRGRQMLTLCWRWLNKYSLSIRTGTLWILNETMEVKVLTFSFNL